MEAGPRAAPLPPHRPPPLPPAACGSRQQLAARLCSSRAAAPAVTRGTESVQELAGRGALPAGAHRQPHHTTAAQQAAAAARSRRYGAARSHRRLHLSRPGDLMQCPSKHRPSRRMAAGRVLGVAQPRSGSRLECNRDGRWGQGRLRAAAASTHQPDGSSSRGSRR